MVVLAVEMAVLKMVSGIVMDAKCLSMNVSIMNVQRMVGLVHLLLIMIIVMII